MRKKNSLAKILSIAILINRLYGPSMYTLSRRMTLSIRSFRLQLGHVKEG